MSLSFSGTKVTRYFKNSVSLAINLDKTLKKSAIKTLSLIYSRFYGNPKKLSIVKKSIFFIQMMILMIFQVSKLLRWMANKTRTNLFNKVIIEINNTSNYSKIHTHFSFIYHI